jgi:hypothetical protein
MPTMSPTTLRLAAAASLAADGAFILVLALAIAVTRGLVAAGLRVTPGDVALLEDLVAVLPFVTAYGIAAIIAAAGIVRSREWADRLGIGVAVIGATIATVGLLLIGVGRDPLATDQFAADGLGVLAVLLAARLVTVTALWVAPAGARADHLTD